MYSCQSWDFMNDLFHACGQECCFLHILFAFLLVFAVFSAGSGDFFLKNSGKHAILKRVS